MPMNAKIILFGLLIALTLSRQPAHAATATLSVAGDRLQAAGLDLPPSVPSLHFVAGPVGGLTGFAAATDTTIQGVLSAPLQERGSVGFWFHTDQFYRSGKATPYFEQRLLELEDLLGISLVAEPESVTLYIGWGKRRDIVTPGARGVRRGLAFDQVIRVILPEFPGPAWHHLMVNWDATLGEANAFVDGTPYQIPGTRIESWKTSSARHLTVHAGPRFPLAGIRIADAPIDPAALPQTVGAGRWGALDTLLGVSDLGPLDAASLRRRLLYENALERATDTQGWRLEGPGAVEHDARGLGLRSTRPNGPNGHVVYWVDREFPADCVVEFDFEVLTEHGLNILFFAARGTEGQDALSGGLTTRDGTFIQYTHGDLNSYHISYFANSPNDPRSVANLRKNSGFFLLANGPVGTTRGGLGKTHHAQLVKDGAHIQMAVDGRLIIDFTDDGQRAGPVWGAGYLGFRQMQWSATRYHNLRVYALAPAGPGHR